MYFDENYFIFNLSAVRPHCFVLVEQKKKRRNLDINDKWICVGTKRQLKYALKMRQTLFCKSLPFHIHVIELWIMWNIIRIRYFVLHMKCTCQHKHLVETLQLMHVSFFIGLSRIFLSIQSVRKVYTKTQSYCWQCRQFKEVKILKSRIKFEHNEKSLITVLVYTPKKMCVSYSQTKKKKNEK